MTEPIFAGSMRRAISNSNMAIATEAPIEGIVVRPTRRPVSEAHPTTDDATRLKARRGTRESVSLKQVASKPSSPRETGIGPRLLSSFPLLVSLTGHNDYRLPVHQRAIEVDMPGSDPVRSAMLLPESPTGLSHGKKTLRVGQHRLD